ncbi:uncharacterized protein DSM5745_05861 [Aspergillus mulundensis]|uniref:Nucleoside phosphorylase domain-containing protein n=1 Tax=Aspergillus mulundensis TaxID=1810919 RepID=A0A3D8RY80_9EURO|nr:hypothetical protein DSM5745_05861 [Aspergillus mulundensis]RDW79009.1 hypothetical protein DSM5745_05861 [Aspergillus mulundensis]
MTPKIRRSHDDYTVAWICAIPVETAAAEAMLDEIHESLPVQSNDHNSYSLGRIGEHDVVIACLPSGKYGTVSASSVVVQLLSTFRSIRFGLMVGLGGAVPGSADIRLGDIVVSKPTNGHGGVIEYDFGKVLKGERFQATGMLSRPPQILLTALSKLQARHMNHDGRFLEFYAGLESKTAFARPAVEDRLYRSDYDHPDSTSPTCIDCDESKAVSRPSRKHHTPVVHYGLIASANQVVKNSDLRDELGRKLGAYCIEMEAAGIMDNLPSIVVRGICDYADSHKNNQWQGYASAVAAAYAKELLLYTSVARRGQERKYHVPFDVTALSTAKNFIGRDDELEHLWQHLQPSSQKSQRVAVVHGLGGMGKTQLATRFARSHKDDFTAVLWLNGKSQETLLQSLSSALPKLPGQDSDTTARNEGEVKRNASQVLEWLALQDNHSWLIIFDNVDQYSPGADAGYDVGQFFPAADHGSILITSRLLKLSELGRSFPLQKLDPTHATQLLLQNSGISSQEAEQAKDINRDVADLVKHLDGLPLGITLAGSFIRETGTSFSKYLQYYRESWHNLQSQSGSVRQYEQGNILQTWAVSYQAIRERDPEAAELMLVLAHFDNQDIFFQLLQYGAYSPNRPKWFDSVMSDELVFREKMRTLLGFSFIGAKLQDDSYTMHPVVRDWCLSISESQNEPNAARLKELAFIAVGHMVPSIQNASSWIVQQRLLPHAIYILPKVRTLRLTDSVELRTTFNGIGNLYAGQCKLSQAEEIYQWGLAICREGLGPDFMSDRLVLSMIYALALVHEVQGKLLEAKAAYKQALSGYMALGSNEAMVPMIRGNLGHVYVRSNELEKAGEMYQRAQSEYHEMFGPNHISTLESLDHLGDFHTTCGRLDLAEEMCQTAFKGKMAIVGPDHIQTYYSYWHLARIYQRTDRLGEAEDMFERSIGIGKIYGPDHPATVDRMYNLAIVYQQRGKLKAAEEMYERAVSGFTRTLGPNSIHTLAAASYFAEFWAAQNRVTEAEGMYRRALAGYEQLLGRDHSWTQTVAQRLEVLVQPYELPQYKEYLEPSETPKSSARKCGILARYFHRGWRAK